MPMRSSHLLRFSFAFTCTTFIFFAAANISFARAVISEVMWMGSDLSTADEWLEIANVQDGSGATDLSGYSLTSMGGSGSESMIIRFASGTLLPVGAFAVIGNYSADHSRLLAEPQFVTSSMSLPNTKLLLRLRDASGRIVDEVDDGVGAPFAGDNRTGFPKASMERIDLLKSGTDPLNWMTATVSVGFDSGAVLRGTPGYPTEWGATSSALSSVSSSGSSLSSVTDSSTGSTITSTGSVVSSDPYIESKNTNTNIDQLYISEVLPNASGSDDGTWVEVGVSGSGAVSFQGWSLAYGSKVFALPQSGSLLPGTYLAFRKAQTDFNFSHAAGTVILRKYATQTDAMDYHDLPEGVSVGKGIVGGTSELYCSPTENGPNVRRDFLPSLVVQAGSLRGTDHVSVNFEILPPSDDASPISCSFDFGDGKTSSSCNPPYHSFDTPGLFAVRAAVTNYCGTTSIQTATVEVSEGSSSVSSQRLTSVALASDGEAISTSASSTSSSSCVPQTSSGIVINELLPNPVGTDTGNEWIELRNLTANSVNLCGWEIESSQHAAHKFILSGLVIGGRGYLYLPGTLTGVHLSNVSGSVMLVSPSSVTQTVVYANAKDGVSFARTDAGDFLWTKTPTPDTPNSFYALMVPTKAITKITKTDQIISQIQGLNDNNMIPEIVRYSSSASTGRRSSRPPSMSKRTTSYEPSRSHSSIMSDTLSASLLSPSSSSSSWMALSSIPLAIYGGSLLIIKYVRKRK